MMDLTLRTPHEVVKLLCERLRKERIAHNMTQAEVAARAGVGVNTVSNLESGKNVGFENVVSVAITLGRMKDLEELFKPQFESLDDILHYEQNVNRQRIKKKS